MAIPLAGKIVNACTNVLVEGMGAARKTDLTEHAGRIGEGVTTVIVSGASMPAAHVGHRFVCTAIGDAGPHVGGTIVQGAASVLVGGKPFARNQDMTMCLGDQADNSGLSGDAGGDGDGLTEDERTECQRLWDKYDGEAEAIIAPYDHDHRERNHAINAAYADLYLKNNDFAWAGLAGYASKQVGCAMDHSKKMMAVGDGASGIAPFTGPFSPYVDGGGKATSAMAKYTYNMLGKGNKNLFLDIYPIHRFYQEEGWDKLKKCASSREPPVPAAALDGFKALEDYKATGDKKYLKEHVRAIAYHEQVEILQRDIYNDAAMRAILDVNELPANAAGLGTLPASVQMNDTCKDPTGGKQTLKFGEKGREHIYDVDERMDWILNDIGDYYLDNMGSPEHKGHMENIRDRGNEKGVQLP